MGALACAGYNGNGNSYSTVAADCGERTVSPPVRAPGAGTGDDAVREDASMAQRETDALVAAQRQ